MFVGFESSECECFLILGAELRALSMSGKYASIKLYFQHFICTCVCEGWRSEGLDFPQVLPTHVSSNLLLDVFLPSDVLTGTILGPPCNGFLSPSVTLLFFFCYDENILDLLAPLPWH